MIKRAFTARVAVIAALVASVAVVTQVAAEGAGTSGGAATVVNNNNQPLTSGGSSTAFSLKLPDPPNNRCVGNSATGGWTLQSYITPQATNPGDLTFSGTGPPSPSKSLFDTANAAYRNRNTDEEGAVVDFPTTVFNFDRFSANGTGPSGVTPIAWTAGTYNIGIACWKSETQTQDKFWNAVITFAADSSDPRGLTWTVASQGTTTTTTGGGGGGATTTTTSGSGGASTTTTRASTTTTTAGSGSTTTSTTTAGGSTSTTRSGTSVGGTTATTRDPLARSGGSVAGQLVLAGILFYLGALALVVARRQHWVQRLGALRR